MPQVAFYTDHGLIFNEDFVYAEEHFGFIVDGATGVSSLKLAEGNSDAQVLSHQLGHFLYQHLADTSRSIPAILSAAINWVRQEFFPEFQKIEDLGRPSCTFACFRQCGDTIELAWLGDSPIIVKTDQTDILFDQEIEYFDGLALKKLDQLLASGLSFTEARAGIQEILIQNRSQKNQQGGYWILDLLGTGIPHLNLRTIPLAEVQQILICSDGFYRVHDLFNLNDFKQNIDQYQDYFALVQAVAELRKIENQADSLQCYPRLKVSDDASVLSVIFDEHK